jgi:alkanesulfonate monooxygenase SsuD/methylene tetrahydromethanopterin reductase-like flavin-dependent oxidoreductase (luciferase family)
LPRRRPWEAARQAVTLDRLSGGRLIFGAGLGYAEHEFVPFGDEWDPKVRAARLDEALDIVAGLWSAEPFSYAGQHYVAAGATWWLELAPDGGPDAYLELIRKGPPSS